MSEDGDFDPNADVPEWINIVVPIAMVVLFITVVWILYKTDIEIPLDILDKWAGKVPLLNKCLQSSDVIDEQTKDSNTTVKCQVDTEQTPLMAS